MYMLMSAALLGGAGLDVDAPPPQDPPLPPPEPDDPTAALVQKIAPYCGRVGCQKFARWRPVLMLGGYEWHGQLPVELSLGVCPEHQGTLDQYMDDDSWRIVTGEFCRQLEAAGTRSKGPKRHLSGVAHVALAPRWGSFHLDDPAVCPGVLPLTAPSDWVRVLDLTRTARGHAETLAEVALVLLGCARTQDDKAPQPVFATHGDGTGTTLAEWAWQAGTDLEGIALVGEAVLRHHARRGTP